MSEHISRVECDEAATTEPLRFIRQKMRATPVPSLTGIRLYAPHAGAGLSRLRGRRSAPYWAYAWAGGLALTQFIAERPDIVAGRSVCDFGSGSGLVAIVAAKHGARNVVAVERDGYARAAIEANAALNNVKIEVLPDFAHQAVDLVVAGDVFYAADVALRALEVLTLRHLGGADVLVGDPYRRDLPRDQLRCLAEYRVRDAGAASLVRAGVFALEARA